MVEARRSSASSGHLVAAGAGFTTPSRLAPASRRVSASNARLVNSFRPDCRPAAPSSAGHGETQACRRGGKAAVEGEDPQLGQWSGWPGAPAPSCLARCPSSADQAWTPSAQTPGCQYTQKAMIMTLDTL